MLTTLLIVLLALVLVAYVALPLLNPAGADPLPSEEDPERVDLEEERDALLRAIRELDGREDLSPERREQLRSRYEAKAAKVLRQLEERKPAPARKPTGAPARPRGVPYGTLTLLGLMVVIGVSMGTWLLPRVGEGTVTTFFESDLSAAQALRDAQRAVELDPSAENLLALADLNWQLNDAEGAFEAYSRAVNEAGAESALAFRRLGFLELQNDLQTGLDYLQRSRALEPQDLDTLYAIAEVQFTTGDVEAAIATWEEYLAAPGGADDPIVTERLELARTIGPLQQAVAAEPSHENLLALADAYWDANERNFSVQYYLQVLTQFDPNDPRALGRTGQLMFLSGVNEDAIALMERAALSEAVDPETLLFLGNAYYSAERYGEAATVWERHVALVGEEQAGRVPALIEEARALEAGEEPPGGAPALAQPAGGEPGVPGAELPAGSQVAEVSAVAGADLFAEHCTTCHGPQGQGGMGPRLQGERRARNETNVRNAVRYGRGMMPGFDAVLSSDELDALVEYVTTDLARSN